MLLAAFVCIVLLTGGDPMTLSDILIFWTGSSCEPPLGFPMPAIVDDRQQPPCRPLGIDFYEDEGRLPYSSTCAMRLYLPKGVSEAKFRELLIRALTECAGFGKP